ncbi:CHASE domain-containing protein [Pseudomonas lalucatii]|nr:CHASE domain-containing protein [Pseudomonas lalucatii]
MRWKARAPPSGSSCPSRPRHESPEPPGHQVAPAAHAELDDQPRPAAARPGRGTAAAAVCPAPVRVRPAAPHRPRRRGARGAAQRTQRHPAPGHRPGLLYRRAPGPGAFPELQPWLDGLLRQGRHIRNIGLAPGNRIAFVYPLAGNERALGLYYPDQPQQWPAVQRLIASRAPGLDGPLQLVQGGRGLIYRVPVFLGDDSYWG